MEDWCVCVCRQVWVFLFGLVDSLIVDMCRRVSSGVETCIRGGGLRLLHHRRYFPGVIIYSCPGLG